MPAVVTQTKQNCENSGKQTIESVKPHRISGKRTNGWTPERRRKQAEAIRRWQPWARSTGPRTQAGKAVCRRNAEKHGLYSAVMKDLLQTLRDIRIFHRAVRHVRRNAGGPVTNAAVRDRFEALKAARSAGKLTTECAEIAEECGASAISAHSGVKPSFLPAAP